MAGRSHGRNLAKIWGDTLLPMGDISCFVPFLTLIYENAACLGRHGQKNGEINYLLCHPALNPRIVSATLCYKIAPMVAGGGEILKYQMLSDEF